MASGRPAITWLAVLSTLAVLGAVAYAPSLPGDFLYDDLRFVEYNPAVETGAGPLDYFVDPRTQTADDTWHGLYRPLRTLSFRAVRFLGAGPAPQRAVNLALHVLAAFLVWHLLRRLPGTERTAPAFAGAIAFLLHPLAVEAVAWISSRGDVLAMTAMLGAVLAHLGGTKARRYAGPLLFALALLAKESAAVLPGLLLLVDLRLGGVPRARSRIGTLAVHGAVLVAFLAVRLIVLGGDRFGQGAGLGYSRLDVALSLGAVTVYYLKSLILPTGLAFDLIVPPGSETPLLSAVGLLLAAAVPVAAVLLARRARGVALALAWFAVALLPVTVLQLVFPLNLMVADRFAYPGLVAVAMLVALLFARGPRYAVATALCLATLLPLTMSRAAVWKTHEALWGRVLARDPVHPRALAALGEEALRDDEPARAREYLLRAVAVDPRNPKVQALLGETCEFLGATAPEFSRERIERFGEAWRAYQTAVRLWETEGPRDRDLYRDLYREALPAAAMFAVANRQYDLAERQARRFLAMDAPLPGNRARADRLAGRLRILARTFGGRGQPALAASLSRVADRLDR